MRRVLTLIQVVAACSLGVVAVACGSDESTSPSDPAPGTRELPTIVVTTNILGDIVAQAVGNLAEVEVIMPAGSDPHDFSPSVRQAESMETADLLVANGAGFEEGMIDIIEQVESAGTPVFEFAAHVELLEDGRDPHIWTDPSRMITAVEAFGAELAILEGIDVAAVEAQVQSYVDQLGRLVTEMTQTLSAIPAANRVLVTNHEVFGYFADRFDFEVVGAVVPSSTTSAEPSAAQVEALAELIEQQQIPAIFADTSSPTRLAEAIASSVGNDVAVVALFSESLGEPGSGAETYIGMMSTNASLIAVALAPV